MFTSTWMGHYIPLTWLSLGLNYALGGMEPWGYHLGNLLIHAANAALLFLVARRLLAAAASRPFLTRTRGVKVDDGTGGRRAIALRRRRPRPCCGHSTPCAWSRLRGSRSGETCSAASSISSRCSPTFGGHPGRTPSPADGSWHPSRPSRRRSGSKAIAMTLPVTLLVLDVYPLRRHGLGWPALLREKLGHFALAAVGAGVASWAVTRGAGWTSYDAYGLEARVAMTGYSFWFYPWKLIWPERLSPLTSFPPGSVSRCPVPLADRRRGPATTASCCSHAAGLRAPSPRGFTRCGSWWRRRAASPTPATSSRTPLAGLSSPALGGFAVLAGRRGHDAARSQRGAVGGSRRVFAQPLMTAGGLARPAPGAGSWVQSRVWHDSESLWRSAVTAHPTCALCRQKLGGVLQAAGLPREAEGELTRAITLRPERPTAHNSLGVFYVDQGRLGEAEAEFREAIRLAPQYAEATVNLGALYARQRRYAEAIPVLRRAVVLSPQSGERPGQPRVRPRQRGDRPRPGGQARGGGRPVQRSDRAPARGGHLLAESRSGP